MNSLIIIGVSGAGKATLAGEISSRLGLPVFDSENEVAACLGENPATYLVRAGEQAYEEAFKAAASKILENEGIIVLEPGVTREAEIQEKIVQRRETDALVVELFADTSTLMRRTGLNAPRSVALGPMRKMLTELVAQYRSEYEGLAHLVIDTSLSKPQYIADRVLAFKGPKGVSLSGN